MKISKITRKDKTYYVFKDLDSVNRIIYATLLYSTFYNTIEMLVSKKSDVYFNIIPHIEFEDMQQEMRLIALEALAKFDLKRLPMEHNRILEKDVCAILYMYLSITIVRRILNYRRDNYFYPYMKFPCDKCKKFEGDRENPCDNSCGSFKSYDKYVKAKKSVLAPEDLDEINRDDEFDLRPKDKNLVIKNDQELLMMMGEAVEYDFDILNDYLYHGKLSYGERAKIKKVIKEYFSEEN